MKKIIAFLLLLNSFVFLHAGVVPLPPPTASQSIDSNMWILIVSCCVLMVALVYKKSNQKSI